MLLTFLGSRLVFIHKTIKLLLSFQCMFFLGPSFLLSYVNVVKEVADGDRDNGQARSLELGLSSHKISSLIHKD
jgi:hypothetical protein